LEGWHVASLAASDKSLFGGLVDSYPVSPEYIAQQLEFIDGLKTRMLAQEKSGATPLPSNAKASAPPKKDDDEGGNWDPRLE
jgi:hypothetical protein